MGLRGIYFIRTMALTPAKQDIYYYSGDELNKSYAVTKDRLPVDMSGDTLVMQIKKHKTDPLSRAVAVLTSAGGTITVFGANNSSYTLSGIYVLDEGTYYYDIERTNINETTQYGRFIVTGDVTRI